MALKYKKFPLMLLLLAMIVVFGENAYSQASAATFIATVQNPAIGNDTLYFDVYVQRTGSEPIYLENCDFSFNFTNANFTTPVINVVAGTGLAGYTMAPQIVGGTKLVFSISPPVPGSIGDFGTTILEVSNVGSGSRIGRVLVKGITNAVGTAGITWRTGAIANATIVIGFDTADPLFSGVDISASQPYTNPGSIPLPVELVSLTASARGRNIDLSWATKTELNNYGFDVERKAVTSDQSTVNSWTKVGFVEGKGTTNTPQSYSYKDAVKSAGTFTYRLKQTDRDGKFTYSAQVEAKAALTADDYKMSQNYPNPFNPSTKFNFAVSTPQQVSVKVFNSVGQEVQTLFNGIAPADQIQEVTFDGARLASGIYFYVLRTQGRVEVKKMMMMK